MSDELKPDLPEPPKSKKQNSYTYWVDDKNKSRQLPPEHQPKKVQGPIQPVPTEQGPSAWNSLGTWQQKKIALSEIQASSVQAFKQLIAENGLEGIELGSVKIQGDAYKVYKKNKWGVMYEIHGSIQFKNQQKSAKIKLVQLTNMGDREYQLSGNAQLRKILQPKSDSFIKAIESVLARHNS